MSLLSLIIKLMQHKGLLTRYVLAQFPSFTLILKASVCMHSEIHLPSQSKKKDCVNFIGNQSEPR